jgi:hypothetical protein
MKTDRHQRGLWRLAASRSNIDTSKGQAFNLAFRGRFLDLLEDVNELDRKNRKLEERLARARRAMGRLSAALKGRLVPEESDG